MRREASAPAMLVRRSEVFRGWVIELDMIIK